MEAAAGFSKKWNENTAAFAFYKLGALLTNCLTCLDGNQVGESFHCQPPILEEYLV